MKYKGKDYCLTSCAKSKISKVKEWFIRASTLITMMLLLIFIVVVIPTIIGLIVQAVVVSVQGNLISWITTSPIELGWILILGTFLGGLLLIVIRDVSVGMYKYMLKPIYSSTRKLVYVIAGEGGHLECNLFEECTK